MHREKVMCPKAMQQPYSCTAWLYQYKSWVMSVKALTLKINL